MAHTSGNPTTAPKEVLPDYPLSDGLIKFKSGNQFGFMTQAGSIAIKAQFFEASNFSEGIATVVLSGPCFYFEDSACGAFNPIRLGDAPDGIVLPHCKPAFISKSGDVVGNLRIDQARRFSAGLAPVRIDGDWGFVDKTGQLAIPAIFENAFPFSGGLARIRLNDRFGFIDKNGSLVIEPRFVDAEDFSDGLAPVQDENDVYYYINTKGERAFPGEFKLASFFFKGLAHVRLQGQEKSTYAYINKEGRIIFKYTEDAAPDR